MRPPDFDEADIWADATDAPAWTRAHVVIGCILAAAVIVGACGLAKLAGWWS